MRNNQTVDFSAEDIRDAARRENREAVKTRGLIYLIVMAIVILWGIVGNAGDTAVTVAALEVFIVVVIEYQISKKSRLAMDKRNALKAKELAYRKIRPEQAQYDQDGYYIGEYGDNVHFPNGRPMTYADTMHPEYGNKSIRDLAAYDRSVGKAEDELIDQMHAEHYGKKRKASTVNMANVNYSPMKPVIESEIHRQLARLGCELINEVIMTDDGDVDAAIYRYNGSNICAIDDDNTLYAPHGFKWVAGNPDDLISQLRKV